MDAPGKHDGPRRVDRIEPVTSTLRCPTCQDPVRLEVPTPWVACAACLARHHGSCWADVRQCGACGHAVRLRPDGGRPRWLQLLSSAVLGSLLTAAALNVALPERPVRPGQSGPIVDLNPQPSPDPTPAPPPAQRPVDLSHVRVGQRYVYEMQNNLQQTWTVREVGADVVKYEMALLMGGNPLGDPTTQEWRYSPPGDPVSATSSPDVKLSRERLAISGVELDCVVAEASGYRSWVPMTPGSATVPTFPMIVKTIQLADNAVVMELVRIEQDAGGPRGDGGYTTSGYRLSGDRTQVQDSNDAWVPYNPMVHGDLPN